MLFLYAEMYGSFVSCWTFVEREAAVVTLEGADQTSPAGRNRKSDRVGEERHDAEPGEGRPPAGRARAGRGDAVGSRCCGRQRLRPGPSAPLGRDDGLRLRRSAPRPGELHARVDAAPAAAPSSSAAGITLRCAMSAKRAGCAYPLRKSSCPVGVEELLPEPGGVRVRRSRVDRLAVVRRRTRRSSGSRRAILPFVNSLM